MKDVLLGSPADLLLRIIARIYFNEATKYAEQKNYNEAIINFQKAIDVDVKFFGAYVELARFLHEVGRNIEAIDIYKKVIAIKAFYEPSLPEVYLNLNSVVITMQPCHEFKLPKIYVNMGSIYASIDKYDEAIIAYKEAIKLDPHLSGAYKALGYALQVSGQEKNAIDAFKKALEINPKSEEIYGNLGVLYFDMGVTYYADALVCYERAIKFNPDIFETQVNIARLLAKIAEIDPEKSIVNYELAIKHYQKAIGINPDYIEIYSYIGNIFLTIKNFRKAYEAYDQGLTIDKQKKIGSSNETLAEIYGNMGLALKELGFDQKALEVCNEAIKLSPCNSELYNHKGSLLCKMKKYIESLDAYEQAIKLSPNDFAPYLNKCDTLYRLAESAELNYKYGAAKTFYREAIKNYEIVQKMNKVHDHIIIAKLNANKDLALEALKGIQKITIEIEFSGTYQQLDQIVKNFDSGIKISDSGDGLFEMVLDNSDNKHFDDYFVALQGILGILQE